jgi:hypothetical protein
MHSSSAIFGPALCASLILVSAAFGEEKPNVSQQGLLQVCLAPDLPPTGEASGWLMEMQSSSPDPSRPFAYQATGTLISTGEVMIIEEEALEQGCDLVIQAEQGELRYYLLESAPDGPMPDTKATLELISKHAIPLTGLMFTHVEVADDPELLLLLREELDQLAASHGIQAETLPHYLCRPGCEPMTAP